MSVWLLSDAELFAKHPTFEAVLEIEDPGELAEALRRHLRRARRQRPEALPREARVVENAESVLSVSLSGGLSNVVPFRPTSEVVELLNALREVGAEETANVLDEALALQRVAAARGESAKLRSIDDWVTAMGRRAFGQLARRFDVAAREEVEAAILGYLFQRRDVFRGS